MENTILDSNLNILILMLWLYLSNTILIVYFFLNKKSKPVKQKTETSEEYNIDEASKIKQFIDKIIKEKFEFYLYSEILPVYAVGKKLDKQQVNDLKEKIFTEISLLLNKNTKKLVKKYYITEGIEIYIAEKILININKVDSTYYNTKDDITI